MPEKTSLTEFSPPRPRLSAFRTVFSVLSLLAFCLAFSAYNWTLPVVSTNHAPSNAREILQRCSSLRTRPNPTVSFRGRTISDRFEPGRNVTYLITNATIFTGVKNDNGTVQTLTGDLLLKNGLIQALGKDIPREWTADPDMKIIRANGSWVTPGLVDINSQLGIFSSPALRGAADFDSKKGPVLPWLRSIDGFHTYDNGFELAIGAGITSVQVLAGASNSIGGQAFVVKLRKTSQGSPASMIVDPPQELEDTSSGLSKPPLPSWRHLMQSCSEKTRRYGNRMDLVWSLRSAYHEARTVMKAQDMFCEKAEAGIWDLEGVSLPDNYQWEMLVDVLRGKVKVTNDCSEAVDLDNMVRLSNEFGFPLATFVHASEAYLVPTVLNGSWNGAPAIAMQSTNHRHSRESFRGSEFAPRILADHNFSVVMASDYPAVNSRLLIDEARKAFHFGLTADLALASVTSVPANALGLDHRIGALQEGYDADVVMWDSHPLQLGAAPVHVWIDGIMEIPQSIDCRRSTCSVAPELSGDHSRMMVPDQPTFEKERQDTVAWDGLPPLSGIRNHGRVVFRNVKEVWTKGKDEIEEKFVSDKDLGVVVVNEGKITCVGMAEDCQTSGGDEESVDIDLHGGSISPGFLTFGSLLGLEGIASEPSTTDGRLFNALTSDVPSLLHDVGGVVRAVDALMFQTRPAQLAYRYGVTLATSSLAKPHRPFDSDDNMIWGISTTFSTAAAHALEPGAILQSETALHIRIERSRIDSFGPGVSVSTRLAALRRLLYGWESTDTDTGLWFRKAAEGVIPLVIEVDNADIMASLLILRAEVDEKIGGQMRMVFVGATEAHLLAEQLSRGRVGVILTSLKSFPSTWDQRRILPGPPLTNQTTLQTLLDHGVVVGIGTPHPQSVINTRFEISQAYHDSTLTTRQAYGLATTNLEHLLGVKGIPSESADLVAFDGGSAYNISGKVIAVVSPQRKAVDMF